MWERRIRLTGCPFPCIKIPVLCLIFENIEIELSPSRPWFSLAYDFNAPSCDGERLNYFQPQSMFHDRLVSFVLRQQYLDCMLFPSWDFLCSPPLELLQHLILHWKKSRQVLFHLCHSHSHSMYAYQQYILYSLQTLNCKVCAQQKPRSDTFQTRGD